MKIKDLRQIGALILRTKFGGNMPFGRLGKSCVETDKETDRLADGRTERRTKQSKLVWNPYRTPMLSIYFETIVFNGDCHTNTDERSVMIQIGREKYNIVCVTMVEI